MIMPAVKHASLCELPAELLWKVIDAGDLSVADLRETCTALWGALHLSLLPRLTLSTSLTAAEVQSRLSRCPGDLELFCTCTGASAAQCSMKCNRLSVVLCNKADAGLGRLRQPDLANCASDYICRSATPCAGEQSQGLHTLEVCQQPAVAAAAVRQLLCALRRRLVSVSVCDCCKTQRSTAEHHRSTLMMLCAHILDRRLE